MHTNVSRVASRAVNEPSLAPLLLSRTQLQLQQQQSASIQAYIQLYCYGFLSYYYVSTVTTTLVGGLLLLLLLGVDWLLLAEDGRPRGDFRQHEEETPGVRG